MDDRIVRFAFSFVITLALAAGISYARLLRVPADYQTLQSAIDATRAGDTVLVSPGIYRENVVIDTSNITVASLILITGNPHYIDSTIIDGGGNDCVVSIEVIRGGCTLRGFTIRNGGGQNFGGGVDCQYGSPILLEDLKVTGNTAISYGGGIYSRTGVTMRRVSIFNNEAGRYGGGIAFRGREVLMEDCSIFRNRAGTSGGGFSNVIEGGGSTLRLRHCLIHSNEAPVAGAGLFFFCSLTLDNCTIADNFSRGEAGVAGVFVDDADRYPVVFHNSIFFGNQGHQVGFGACEYVGEVEIPFISYCDIEEGLDSIRNPNAIEINWGAGNIDAAPQFVNPNEGDYYLSRNSPCIDAGDPDSPPDPDGSRCDIGWKSVREYAVLYGSTLDAANGLPLADVHIIDDSRRRVRTGLDGRWLLRSIPGDIILTASKLGYNDTTFVVPAEDGDSLLVDIRLSHPEFNISQREISERIPAGDTAERSLTIANNANGRLNWRADIHLSGEYGVEEWSLIDTIPAGRMLNDGYLQGVTFADDIFYITRGTEGVPQIILLDRAGQELRRYNQPVFSRYGFANIVWDGGRFWGACGDTLFEMTREFEVSRRFHIDFNHSRISIACDAANERLWLCGTTTAVYTYNRDGNRFGEPISNDNLHIYSLMHWADDPDGPGIYIANLAFDGFQLLKIPDGSRQIEFMRYLPYSENEFVLGGCITDNYSRVRTYTMINVIGRYANLGGDRIDIRALEDIPRWLSVAPVEGSLNASSQTDITLFFRTIIGRENFCLPLGLYTGEIRFAHNALSGLTALPAELTVVEPVTVSDESQPIITNMQISTIYPNPFNSTAVVRFSLPEASMVNVALYDVRGAKREARSGWFKAGEHSVTIGGQTGMSVPPGGRSILPTGVYLLRLQAGEWTAARKVVVLK